MKHVLASVALLALATGCDSPREVTSHETTTTGVPNASVGSVTGNSASSFSAASGNTGTTTGGQVGAGGAFNGSGGQGGEGGDDDEYGVAGEAGAPNYPENPYPAVAMTRAQRQAFLEAGAAVSTTGSGQENADDLWVVIADTALVCTEFPPFPECGGHWNVDFMLPRSLQHVGTYDLDWFGYAYATEAEDPSLPDICGGGGGSGSINGRIVEVLAIDASEIRFRLHSDPAFIDDEINGIYTVPLCP